MPSLVQILDNDNTSWVRASVTWHDGIARALVSLRQHLVLSCWLSSKTQPGSCSRRRYYDPRPPFTLSRWSSD